MARIEAKNKYVRRSRSWQVGEGEEARFSTGTEFVRSLHLITVNSHVVESEEVTKRIRPKTRCQGGTREHGTDRMSNVSMGTLHGPILVGRVGSYRLDCVPAVSKQIKAFLAETKFSSKVHPNVFGIDHGSGILNGKPFGESLGWRNLGAKSSTVKCVFSVLLKWSRRST
jgi:hypothetical protein